MSTESLWPPEWGLHPDHCRDVVEGGAYDIPWSPKTPPIVADLGANVGGFVRWASKRWPGCEIHAFEPEQTNFAHLTETCEKVIAETTSHVHLHNVAVAGHTCRAQLNLHATAGNCGEWSLMFPAGLASVMVDVIAAKDLPRADILKMDIEGAEAAVLSALHLAGRMAELSAIMLEVHSPTWVSPIKLRMADAGFTLTGEREPFPNRSELKFVKTNLLAHPL